MNDSNPNPWAWWQAALKGNVGQITDTPEQGYYRVRRKGAQWEPVGIWRDQVTGEWVAVRNGNTIIDVHQLWSYACRHAVTFDAYRKAVAGNGWDDEPAVKAGHNLPTDPFERLKVELADDAELAKGYLQLPVETSDHADRVAILAKRIGEEGKRADIERTNEKQPHLEAGRAVDAKWKPVIETADDLRSKLKKHLEPYLKLQARQTEAKVNAGRTGARVSLRSEKVAHIVDYDACMMALKDHPEMRSLVQVLAQRAVRGGVELAGVEVKIEERVQ